MKKEDSVKTSLIFIRNIKDVENFINTEDAIKYNQIRKYVDLERQDENQKRWNPYFKENLEKLKDRLKDQFKNNMDNLETFEVNERIYKWLNAY